MNTNPLSNISLIRSPSTPETPTHLLSTDPSLPPDTYILRIDNSSLEVFQTCPRAAFHHLVQRRIKPPSSALKFGGAVHVALEAYYKAIATNTPIIPADLITLALNYYAGTQVFGTDHRTPEYLSTVLLSYFHEYEWNDFPVADPSHVERPFALTLGELELDRCLPFTALQLLGEGPDEPLFVKKLIVLWSGRIDLFTSYLDKPSICDHKTSSIEGPTFYEQFRLSQPIHGYVWAARQMFDIPKLNHFVLNAIILRKVTKTGKGIEFIRRPYDITDYHINEWQQDVMLEISNFVHLLSESYFPKAPIWCVGKFGVCQFHDVCTLSSDAEKKALIQSELYAPVTWSPLNDR